MLTVRKARMSDAVSLAPRLRADDKEELEIASSVSLEETLLEGIKESSACYVAVSEDDTPEIIFGVVPSGEPLLGFVWMVGSEAIDTNFVQVVRETKQWLDRIRGNYSVLGNAVYANNSTHIRWLRWAGFHFLRGLDYNGAKFLEFAYLHKQESSNV